MFSVLWDCCKTGPQKHCIFFKFGLKKVLKIFWKKVLGYWTFSSSLNASSISAINFTTESKTLRAEAISNIVRVDWGDWLALYQFFMVSITSATKRNRGICMLHWLLVAPQALKSVLPVAASFSYQALRTISRIRAHQSTRETINTSLWRRKAKPASVNYFTVVVLATNKTCGAFPWRVSVFSELWSTTSQLVE